MKNHDFTTKNHIFSNFRGGTPPPPGSAPGYGFLFRSEKKFRTRELVYFFPLEYNIRLYDKNSESDYFFFLHQN